MRFAMITDFLGRFYVPVNGRSTPFDQFVKLFHDFLFAHKINPTDWPAERIRDHLEREGFVIGFGGDAKIVGNLESKDRPKRWVRKPNQPHKLRLEKLTASE
jgi:hypothetical protein